MISPVPWVSWESSCKEDWQVAVAIERACVNLAYRAIFACRTFMLLESLRCHALFKCTLVPGCIVFLINPPVSKPTDNIAYSLRQNCIMCRVR